MELNKNQQKLKTFLTKYLPGNTVVTDEFILLFKEKEAGKDDCVIRSGEVSKHLVFVVSGLLRMFSSPLKGDDFITGFFPENTLVTSYTSFKEQENSDYCIEAHEPSLLLMINHDDLLNPASGAVGQLLLSHYADIEHQRKNEYINILHNKDAEARYLWFSINYPDLKERVCDQYIASFLGLSRECVVRKKKLVECCKK